MRIDPSRPKPALTQTPGMLVSTERKVRAGFGFLLGCLIAIAIVSYPTLTRLREDNAWVEHSYQVIGALRMLLSSATDAETGERGYIITGEDSYLEPYRSGLQNVRITVGELRRLTADSPVQQRWLDVLEPLLAERLAVLQDGLELRRQGFNQAEGVVLSGRGKQLHDQVRGIVTEMEASEQNLLAAREARAQRASRQAKAVIVGGSALAVIIVVAGLFVIGLAFTASRYGEVALQESRDQLGIRVRERTSELSRANEALGVSEQALAAVIGSAMDAVISIDEQQRITLFNPAAAKTFGCAAGEALGQPLERFIPQRFRTAHAEHVRLFSQSKLTQKAMTERQEICGLRADGTEFPIEASISKTQVGDQKTFTVILRDITERKRAEAALRESEAKFRAVVENSHDGIIFYDADGVIRYRSPSFQRITGFAAEERLGHSGFETVHPDDLASVRGTWAKVLSQPETPHALCYRVQHKDGTWRTVESRFLNLLGSTTVQAIVLTLCDVTESMRAEEALRESLERLERVLDVQTVGVMFWDLNTGVMVDANDAFLKLMGYSRSDVEERKLTWQKLTPPEYIDVSRAEVEKFLATGRVGPYEKEYFRKDGTRHWLLFAGSSLGDNQCVEFCVDISARKKTEEALQRSESELKEAHRIARLGSWEWDPKTDIVTWSEEIHRVFGSDPNLGVPGVADQARLFTPESWTRLEAALAEAVRSGTPYELDLEVVRVDGTRAWMIARGEAERDASGQVGKLRGTVQDITERKRAEEALHHAALQRALALEAAHMGWWQYDPATGIVSSDRRHKEIFGFTDAEYPEDATGYRARLHPDDVLRSDAAVATAMIPANEGKAYHNVARIWRPDGSIRWMESHGLAIFEGEGPERRAVRIVGAVLDITERKIAEEELARRTMELERSNADLEQFAYVASHDLKEPLRAVAGFVRLLQKRYEGKFDARANEFIAGAIDGGTRMQTLIDDLLAFSRVRTRGAKFDAVECQKALDVALQNIALAIRESGAVVSHDPLPAVRGDAAQLASLFQNLIGNALKFHGAAPPRIHVAAQRNGTHWQFSVRDNGIGIESQYFGRIFGIFQRLHTRREYPGTGIGLAICKKIVERHEGRIWLESVPGEGSTFFFTLPDTHAHDRPLEREIHA